MDRMIGAWDKENNPCYVVWHESHAAVPAKVGGGTVEIEHAVKEKLFQTRFKAVGEYGFAIPSEEALRMIAKYSPKGLVEIGAGNGYYAGLLRKIGVDPVLAFDPTRYPSDAKGAFAFKKMWSPVDYGTHEVLETLPGAEDLTLFICWPGKGHWVSEALRKYKGKTFIYIGEGFGGNTADEEFFGVLDKGWEKVDGCWSPQWYGFHDLLCVFSRK